MITFKCKMCGGDLHPEENATTCECEYCGSVQTIPTADNEKKGNLFNRANRLRMAAEYDKAAAVYTSITAEFPEEAEAYWGLCLCKYGIEYVEDPVTAKKIPTCHRTRSESIMDDPDFDQACENADAVAKRVYREEAKAIDRLQQDILSVVANESPYDVFICYKETDDNGQRTEDSVLAQDIYDSLTAKGLKVFFARITLEDKLGQQYEPYIYAALHSATVMLVIGTQFEYFDAVWVKNEWSRFLDMMKVDKTKTLIPCYKGIDAYDLPKEFKNLQAQNMDKLGWKQDLVRAILKICKKLDASENRNFAKNDADEYNKYLSLARRAVETQDEASAIKYYGLVAERDPNNWEAVFFPSYLKVLLHPTECMSLDPFKLAVKTSIDMIKEHCPSDSYEKELKRMYDCILKVSIAIHMINIKDIKSRYLQLELVPGKPLWMYYEHVTELFPDNPYYANEAKKYGDEMSEEENDLFKKISEMERESLKQRLGVTDNPKKGCYIATCVYNSYDCPEVWTLRRFRDNRLSTTLLGRLFIRVYYFISPKLVMLFGHSRWFRIAWKKVLDKMIHDLQKQGYSSSEYHDE